MKKSWIYCTIIVCLGLLFAVAILRHPVATNDGPVHVAFSNLLLTLHAPNHPLQQKAYLLQIRPSPNLAVYFLLAAMMQLLPPSLAESIVQILCILGPVAACYFALRVINPRNAWLSVFVLPLMLNQMFFLGLYNHCISMAAFFLAIGTYFWVAKAPSPWRALALSASLILTFLCHASGFIMAFSGVAAMSGTAVLLSYLCQGRLMPALYGQRHALTAILAPLPLAALFLHSDGGSAVSYGIGFIYRLKYFAILHELSVNYPTRDRFVAAALSGILITSLIVVGRRIALNRNGLSPEQRDQAIAAIVAGIAAMIIMLAFPDSMGGGWTHYRRFQIFPYFWILIILAFDSFSGFLSGAMVTVGAASALILLHSTTERQAMVRAQMAPLAEVDRRVGNHCSVLPVVLESKPVEANQEQAWMQYQPFFQATSRLELHGDRVVLFNYLARLSAYPVHFRPEVEPQKNLFRWEPERHKVNVEKVDLSHYESISGMRVDYILLWGNVNKSTAEIQEQVKNGIANFDVNYKSADGRVTLYRRRNASPDQCVPPLDPMTMTRSD